MSLIAISPRLAIKSDGYFGNDPGVRGSKSCPSIILVNESDADESVC